MKSEFISAIRAFQKVRITFRSREDGEDIVRICAPMDIGPSRRSKDRAERFHLWDFASDATAHVLSLRPEQILRLEILPESFDPRAFVTWDTKASPWFVERDWNEYS